jgi:tetratricopeptide (TPR) repeat protein
VPPSSPADTKAPPHPPTGSIARWIQQRLAPNRPSNAEAQQRELERLVHLLDADPDAGLRHAPPITSLGQQGWTTEPVDGLPQRKPDFNLNTLSGEPAAAWNVSPSVLELLRLRYRELADRELRLGRFRRAAYIYAHLLGDFVSAAHALKRGGHFHEAAILYETRLHNPLEAARCLVAGGFFDEAIPRLENLAHWFEVAEIHERLGNTAAAAAAFRRDAADKMQSGNPAGAALILSGKLQAHDEALTMLDAGWPHSMLADRCFELSFRILADIGRHDEALQRLRTFAASPIPERLQSSVINILCDFSRTYPDPRVRHRASDLVRCLVGDQLSAPSENPYGLRERVEPLFKLATGDLLFSRDVNRYVLQRLHPHLKAPSASVTSPKPPDRFVPQLIRRIHLGRSARWTSLRSHGPEFFAAGITRQNTLAVRGLWSGETQDVIWPNPPVRPSPSTLLLEFLPDATASLLVALGPRESLPQRTLSAQFPAFPQDLPAGTPPWLPAPLLAVAASSDVLWCLYRTPEDRHVLACLSFAGDVHSTLDVTHFTDPPSPGSPPHPFHLAAVGRSVALAQQTRLDWIDVSGGRQLQELPYPVTALIPTRNTGRAGVVALLESGAVHRWESRPTLVPFAEGFRASHGAFLDRSHLVLISGEACQTFACEASEVRSLGLFPIQHPKATGLVPTATPRECAVLDPDGVITIYQVLPDPADKPSATGRGLPIQTPSNPGE